MAVLARQYVWPDAAGTPTDPDVAFATVGPGPVYEVGQETEAVLILEVSGGDTRAIQVLVEWEFYADGVGTWYPALVRTCLGTEIGDHGTRIRLSAGTRVRFSARRVGGTVHSLLAIRAQTRVTVGDPGHDGQPIELLQHQVHGIECWGDGAGAHAHPAAGPGAHAPSPAIGADPSWIPTGEADTLVLEQTVGAIAATTIEYEIYESTDHAATYVAGPAVNSVVAGVISQTIAQEQLSGAIGTAKSREIAVRPGTEILVYAQRTGGAAGTELYTVARLYRLGR